MMDLLGWTVMAIVALPLFCALVVMAGYRWFLWLGRERGPWVVTRVGVGGREFLVGTAYGNDWSLSMKGILQWKERRLAKFVADRRLADVHPMSRYVGGVR